MKLATAKKKSPILEADVPLDGVHDEDEGGKTFLYDMLKRAGISGKQFAYQMRISRTTKQKWFSGELDDPLERARILCAMLQKTAPHLVPVILLRIAGDKFDGLVLDAVKTSAVKELAKAVNE